MRTFVFTLFVTVTLATAAEAVTPSRESCRQYAGVIQMVADAANTMLSSQSKAKVTDLPSSVYPGDAAPMVRAVVAQNAVNAAMAEYRDALDALAADVRACKPRE